LHPAHDCPPFIQGNDRIGSRYGDCGGLMVARSHAGVDRNIRSLRSATLRWLVGCYSAIALSVVILGSGWVGYEIAQRTGAVLGIETQSDAKAPDAKKAGPKPADAAKNVATKVEPAPKDSAQTKPK